MASLEEQRRIDKKQFRDHLATVSEDGNGIGSIPKNQVDVITLPEIL